MSVTTQEGGTGMHMHSARRIKLGDIIEADDIESCIVPSVIAGACLDELKPLGAERDFEFAADVLPISGGGWMILRVVCAGEHLSDPTEVLKAAGGS